MEKTSAPSSSRPVSQTAPRAPSSGAPIRPALARDPLTSDDIIERLYRPTGQPETVETAPHDAPAVMPKPPRPTHYKVVCISLYTEDIARLEAHVAELKRRGHSKANKSQVIREALLQIDLDKVPRHH